MAEAESLNDEVLLQAEQPDGTFRCYAFSGIPVTGASRISLVSSGSTAGRALVGELRDEIEATLLASSPVAASREVECPEPPEAMNPSAYPNVRKLLVLIASQDQPLGDAAWYSNWQSEQGESTLVTVVPLLPFHQLFTPAVQHDPNHFLRRVHATPWQTRIGETVPGILSRAGVTTSQARIFISYSRAETLPLAMQLSDALTHEGFDVLLERFSVSPGQDFQRRLEQELADKSMVLLLESKGIRLSKWTQLEIDFAKRRRLGLMSITMPDVNPGAKLAIHARIDLAVTDFESEPKLVRAPGETTEQWSELSMVALDRVVADVKASHFEALYRRRLRSELERPEYRDIELIRAEREREAEAQFQRNLADTFLLRSFELHNVRFFESGKYEFAPRVNVLLGKNGYGKTLLFRALAALVQSDLDNGAQLFPPLSHESSAPTWGPGSPVLTLRVDRSGESAETIRDAVYFKKTTGKIPLLAIPDSRFVNRKTQTLAPSTIAASELSRSGAQNFISQEPFEGVVVDLLVKLCQEYDRSRSLRGPIFRLIEEVVRALTDDDEFAFHSINHVGSNGYEILAKTSGNEGNPLPIQSASQGTLSVVVIVGLIYSFLKSLRPTIEEKAVAEAPGIVLIDEIDAHLHPSWQQKIMPILTKRFPNVQFIVSAHSPLLVAGCDRNEVAVLRRNAESDKFYIEMLEQDFLGAKIPDLYRLVFEVGDMDHLYLEYSAKGAAGDERKVAGLIERIESQAELTLEEESQLSDLLRERRLLKRAAEVRATRLQEVELEAHIEALRSEVKRLKEQLRRAGGAKETQ